MISEVLAARMTKLITARARKNKRTARMLANARKDHSIPLKGCRGDRRTKVIEGQLSYELIGMRGAVDTRYRNKSYTINNHAEVILFVKGVVGIEEPRLSKVS